MAPLAREKGRYLTARHGGMTGKKVAGKRRNRCVPLSRSQKEAGVEHLHNHWGSIYRPSVSKNNEREANNREQGIWKQVEGEPPSKLAGVRSGDKQVSVNWQKGLRGNQI